MRLGTVGIQRILDQEPAKNYSRSGKSLHRILYINVTGRVAGAEKSLLQLIRGINRTRFTPFAAVPAEGFLATDLRMAGARILRIPELRLRRTASPVALAGMGGRWLRASLAVARAARQWGIDLIHSNTTSAHCVGSLAGIVSGVPTIWHVRDMQRFPWLESMADRSTGAVIYVSRATREAVPLEGVDRACRCVIHNAINADLFRRAARPGEFRAEKGIGPDRPLLLMAAQMVPWKGHRSLIRATARLKETYFDVRTVIAGSDMFGEHARYVRELGALVDDLKLQRHVLFTGYRGDVPTLMADANVVVVPSQGEPFGRVALEAMCCAKPVVASNDAGLAEIVEHEKTGLLVPPHSPERLAAAVGRLLGDPNLRTDLGRAGQARVKSRFSIQEHVRQVQDVYEQLCGKRHRRGA